MNRAVLGVIIVTAVLAVALGKYTFGRIDRLNVSWSVAWLKTLVIVVGITALVAVIPGWVMTLQVVADLDKIEDVLVITDFRSLGRPETGEGADSGAMASPGPGDAEGS